MPAWLHLRKSRHLGDPDDPHLLANHALLLGRLAAEDEQEIPPEHVIREVESGEYLRERPEFLAFLRAIERLPADAGGVLYCMALDRLCRGDEREMGRVRYALRHAGIRLRTPAGWIDLSDPDESLLAGVRLELARRELLEYKRRMEAMRRAKLIRGELLTNLVCFGYRYSKDRDGVETEPGEFAVLRAWCRDVRRLSLRQLGARDGVAWQTVRDALHNPIICGYSVRRHARIVSRTGRSYSRLLPRSLWQWAERPGSWAAACSRAEWDEIQRCLARRVNRAEDAGADAWCRDILRFTGAPPGRVALSSTHGRALYVHECAAGGRFGSADRAAVHAAVSPPLLARLADPAGLAAAAARHAAPPPSDEPGTDPEALRVAIEAKRQTLARLLRQSVETEEEEIEAARYSVERELQAEIRALSRQLAAPPPAAPPDLAPLLAELQDLTLDLPSSWAELPPPLKRALANALIAAVPVRLGPGGRGKRRETEIGPPLWHPWAGE